MQYGGLCHHAIACQMSDMAVNACCRLEAIDTRLTGRYYQSGFPYWGGYGREDIIKNAADSFHKESAEVRIYLIFYKPNISEFISLYLCSNLFR